MADIVTRLRTGTATKPGCHSPTCDDVDAAGMVMAEAAEEITTLRTDLRCKETEALGYLRAVGTLQDRIANLEKERDDYKDDYFRRHKDAGDHMERALVAEARCDKLEKAASAVIDQWGTPNWKLTEPTAKLIEGLRAALAEDKREGDE